jgi:hypothetical protein
MSVISNPSAGNVYFDRSGSATTSTTQPNRDGGAISNASEASTVNTRMFGIISVSGVGVLITGAQDGVSVPYEPTREFVLKSYSTTLGGTANTVIQSPGSDFGNLRNPIHLSESRRTHRKATAIRAGYWNETTATWSTLPATGLDSYGRDDAARPSGETPGELTYEYGSTGGTNDVYEQRNLW